MIFCIELTSARENSKNILVFSSLIRNFAVEKKEIMRRPEIVKQIKEAIQETEPTATAILYGSLRKQWENRPFKTPFYINVVNEGITL